MGIKVENKSCGPMRSEFDNIKLKVATDEECAVEKLKLATHYNVPISRLSDMNFWNQQRLAFRREMDEMYSNSPTNKQL